LPGAVALPLYFTLFQSIKRKPGGFSDPPGKFVSFNPTLQPLCSMAFALYPGESLAEEIKRLLKEESDFVLEKLGSEQKKHKAIHESRKSHKKIRAILRLVRPTIGEKRFKAENTFYRDNARLLSEIRDATALIEALAELEQLKPKDTSLAIFKQLSQLLEAHRSQRSREAIDQAEVMTQARTKVQYQQDQIPSLPLGGNKFKLIRKGLTQIYSRGYLGARQTHRHPSMEKCARLAQASQIPLVRRKHPLPYLASHDGPLR
jgi:hypothetical protein